MKKQFLVKSLLLLLFLFIFTACSSVSKANTTEQAVKNAIESANDYCSKGQYDLALEVYTSALENITDYRLIYNKALVLAYQGSYKEAIEVCQEGFDKFDYILAFKNAQAYYNTLAGNDAEACKVYLEILEINPYDTTTRNTLIERYKALEEYDKALGQALIMWNQGYKTSDNLKLIEELKSLKN